ncbi:MAG TPA: 16S rRNA (uracil(1498)-N(3))-methyltransferase, partial [Blastocatellia bacterium]
MPRRRFYATPDAINGSTIDLCRDESHHLTRVLRLKPGSEVFVFDGCGKEYRCSFLSIKGDRARLEISESLSDEVDSAIHVTLAHGLARGEKFDFIVQKATELGVSAIAPLVTDHADLKLSDERSEKRLERWRRISLESMKQCGRRRLVEIEPPVTLKDYLANSTAPDSSLSRALLLFSEKGGICITDACARAIDKAAVTALVGPEGGWSREELALLGERGAIAVTLGPR